VNRSPALPIDAILSQAIAILKEASSLVIEAPPGAGKTTRVPPALLDFVSGEIVVLEPRRIAARMAAKRVAWELGEDVGGIAGFQVRFEEATSARTRIRFVTEGILTRRLQSDPALKGVGAVVLDEFHERHLESDFALALLKRLQKTRRDLKIVVMSATLDAAPIAHFLDDCPILRSEGRQFALTTRHLPYSAELLPAQVRRAVQLLLDEEPSGHILVFLPGAAEIRSTMRDCAGIAQSHALLMLPLHGDLSSAEQDRVVAPTSQRKLILATSVAESSVTVEGVTGVIDSGLARFATYSPWTGLPTLHVGRVSKASARQRAGRAGRTAPGRVLRLYPEEDFLRRPEHDTPEIARSDLSQLCLTLRSMKLESPRTLDWLDVPPADAVQNAEALLDLLEARDGMEQQLARYPLTPRLSRMLVEAIKRGVGDDGCKVAALVSAGARSESTDLLEAMEAPQDHHARQHTEQLRRLVRSPQPLRHDDDALLLSVLAGFPDRVARRRTGKQVQLSTGVSAEVAGHAPPYEFMVVIDVEDRKEKAMPLIRMTSRIEPEWLIDLFPNHLRERSLVKWNHSAERVEAVSTLLYDELVVQESRTAALGPEAEALLAEKALSVGLERFIDKEAFDNLIARIEFAGLEQPDLAQAMRELCVGLQSFAELKQSATNLLPLLEEKAGAHLLNTIAPLTVPLGKNRRTKVHYEHDRPPWIASRLQDFFGMKETPRIGPEGAPVVIHLLAPNQRAVQTTTDLAGFWRGLYPEVRRGLMRRYPRHAWPERP
jgi:ATP-dependent helicase HrpB